MDERVGQWRVQTRKQKYRIDALISNYKGLRISREKKKPKDEQIKIKASKPSLPLLY